MKLQIHHHKENRKTATDRTVFASFLNYPSSYLFQPHCWNLIKGFLALSISPEFYSWTDRWGPLIWYQSHEVLSSSPDHALILLCVIPAYRSLYGGARVAQTSGPLERSGGA
jgi:hypothetical protein